jgi:hypothetical protein
MNNAVMVGIVLVVGLLFVGGCLVFPQYASMFGSAGPLLMFSRHAGNECG